MNGEDVEEVEKKWREEEREGRKEGRGEEGRDGRGKGHAGLDGQAAGGKAMLRNWLVGLWLRHIKRGRGGGGGGKGGRAQWCRGRGGWRHGARW